MRLKLSVVLLLAASAVISLSAHVTVSPLQSKAGAVLKYELRVHNEAKVAATSIDLDIPDRVTVTEVANSFTSGETHEGSYHRRCCVGLIRFSGRFREADRSSSYFLVFLKQRTGVGAVGNCVLGSFPRRPHPLRQRAVRMPRD